MFELDPHSSHMTPAHFGPRPSSPKSSGGYRDVTSMVFSFVTDAAAVFDGSEDQLQGNYTLVMWENLTDPILPGRELQGIPKLHADTEAHSVVDGEWRSSTSHFGHQFSDLKLGKLREPTGDEIAAFPVGGGYCSEQDIPAALARVTVTDDLAAAIASADLVSESVFERLEIKRDIHRHARAPWPEQCA